MNQKSFDSSAFLILRPSVYEGDDDKPKYLVNMTEKGLLIAATTAFEGLNTYVPKPNTGRSQATNLSKMV